MSEENEFFTVELTFQDESYARAYYNGSAYKRIKGACMAAIRPGDVDVVDELRAQLEVKERQLAMVTDAIKEIKLSAQYNDRADLEDYCKNVLGKIERGEA